MPTKYTEIEDKNRGEYVNLVYKLNDIIKAFEAGKLSTLGAIKALKNIPPRVHCRSEEADPNTIYLVLHRGYECKAWRHDITRYPWIIPGFGSANDIDVFVLSEWSDDKGEEA